MEQATRRIDQASRAQISAVVPPAAATGTRAGKPAIWSVGGGKGGVGKSLITSSLAAAFARRGLRCAVVDADLGCANLHTLLGVNKPKATLSHFLSREVSQLSEVMCETTIPNLWLVSGAGAPPSAANLKHFQMQKLIRHLRKLDVDHVFLDLGAGCTYNVLDFFLSAEHPILVINPEPTSIANTYDFLKAAFYRWLGRVAKQTEVREAIDRVLRESAGKKLGSPRDLAAAVSAIDPVAGQALRDRAKAFAPSLIVNKACHAAHRRAGREIADSCWTDLGAQVDYCGAVDRDACVYDAVRRCRPVLEVAPTSAFSRDIEAIAERLIENHDNAPHSSFMPVERPEPSAHGLRCVASDGLPTDKNTPPPDSLALRPPGEATALIGRAPVAAKSVREPAKPTSSLSALLGYREPRIFSPAGDDPFRAPVLAPSDVPAASTPARLPVLLRARRA